VCTTQPSDLELPTKLTNGNFLPFPQKLVMFVRVQKYSDSISNGINSLHLQLPGVSFFCHIGVEKNNEMKNIETLWPSF